MNPENVWNAEDKLMNSSFNVRLYILADFSTRTSVEKAILVYRQGAPFVYRTGG